MSDFMKILTTIAMACVPLIEVKGAIPYAVGIGISPWAAFGYSQIGTTLVTLVALLLLKPILAWMKSTKLFAKLAAWVERLGEKKSRKVKSNIEAEESAKKKLWASVIGVFAFVAVPLPGTGVWTGSLIATFLNMDFKYAFPTIVIGNAAASTIMMLLSNIFFKGIVI